MLSPIECSVKLVSDPVLEDSTKTVSNPCQTFSVSPSSEWNFADCLPIVLGRFRSNETACTEGRLVLLIEINVFRPKYSL